ncbi:MAG: hypothetical protein M1830_002553 [Pleopsidium flavum]|nr:MAG: hypothetical protein M1830_002553 [Pleopsidium flavum]
MQITVVNTLALGLLSTLAAPATAFWRLPCKVPIVTERADPVISPGKVSSHAHTIMGGNGFGFTMDYAQARASSCSSCTVTKDMSNYWVPTLYLKAKNGSFISVKQNGGATVYYEQRVGHDGEPLLAFPEGFRMVAGNPSARSYTGAIDAQAITYACLNYDGPPTPETNGFPTTNCPSGLRAQVYFPSCWDGVNLDSPDHKSHVAYPALYNNGACPGSHPKHLISIFYEVIWNTGDLANEWHGNAQPFVWSMGDPTGFGYHGDFVNGWDVPTLQKAVDTCTSQSGRVEDCPVFNLISDGQAEGCRIPPSVSEEVSGVLDALPGCNPVQAGPGAAVQKSDCGAPNTIGTPETYFTDVTVSKKWKYVGCGTDNVDGRILTGDNESNDKMTVETCIDYCSGKGFSVAGVEYSTQCYCGNSIATKGAPVPGVMGNCVMKCGGDSGEYCGGYGTISLYQKCGGICQNTQHGVVGNSTTSASTDSSPAVDSGKTPGKSTGKTKKRSHRHRLAHEVRMSV